MRFAWFLALVVFLNGCGHREETPPDPAVAVKIARAEQTELRVTVTAPATIYAREQASVAARITAPIRELRARKGDAVTGGQILAVLESRDILAQREEARASLEDAQANLAKLTAGTLPADIERARGQLASAEAALNQAQKDYQRRSELFKQGAIPGRDLLASETELAQAKANYEVAKRGLELLEKHSRESDIRIAESRVSQAKARLAFIETQVQFTEIRSPFDGTITEQFMYPGDMAKPDSPIFTIADLALAIARAQVPESQAVSVKGGQACWFGSADGAASSMNRSGRVSVVNTAVDPARRTVEVWCEISNSGGTFRSGAFGNTTIMTGTVPGAVVVPLAAVQFDEGTRAGSIYVVDHKQSAHKLAIATGQQAAGKVQVLGGVKPGDAVIVEGGYGLPDGTHVALSEAGR